VGMVKGTRNYSPILIELESLRFFLFLFFFFFFFSENKGLRESEEVDTVGFQSGVYSNSMRSHQGSRMMNHF